MYKGVVNVFIHRFFPEIQMEQYAEQRWGKLEIER